MVASLRGALRLDGDREGMKGLEKIGDLLTNRVRLGAYVEALRSLLTPRSVVIDIGAGPGILSLLACRLGAKRVYAVEPSEAAQVLIDIARDNGLSDRIAVLRQRPTEVTLPEPADLIVSDVLDVLPHHHTRLADIAHARERLLAPSGKVLPDTDTLWLAVASAPETFDRTHRAWQGDHYGLNLRSALRFVDNAVIEHRASENDLLCAPTLWGRVHYRTLSDVRLRGHGICEVSKPGTAHGIVVWFDTQLYEGIGYSNAPGSANAVYGQMLLPWPKAVTLRPGDMMRYDLRADLVGADVLWTWVTEIHQGVAPHDLLLRARQSTFGAAPVSAAGIRKREGSFAPSLSPQGALVLSVLERMKTGKSVRDIAGDVREDHPAFFHSIDDAHGFVGQLSARYSK